MLLLSSLRVSREVEKQACLPTDGQKEIFIWSLRQGSGTYVRTRRASSAHATPGPSHAGGNIISLSVERSFLVFCRGGLWIRNKGPEYGDTMVESGGSSAPQRLLQLERETTARTGSRAERENRGECVKYNVTEGLPKCVATPVVLYARWAFRQTMWPTRGLAIWLRFFVIQLFSKRRELICQR